MKSAELCAFLHHFKEYARPTKDHPMLLLIDNNTSHLCVYGLDFCKENGISVLSFPPHCTHKLQPLDSTVFGPLKIAIKYHCAHFMRTHSGAKISNRDIAGIVTTPIHLSASVPNIISGFRATGIYPLNPDIFTDVDFMPSEFTSLPEAQIEVLNGTEMLMRGQNQ